jgi:hypothetical protein
MHQRQWQRRNQRQQQQRKIMAKETASMKAAASGVSGSWRHGSENLSKQQQHQQQRCGEMTLIIATIARASRWRITSNRLIAAAHLGSCNAQQASATLALRIRRRKRQAAAAYRKSASKHGMASAWRAAWHGGVNQQHKRKASGVMKISGGKSAA